jgi:hypothetical protein
LFNITYEQFTVFDGSRRYISLIRRQIFPVPLPRECGWKQLNLLADWLPKIAGECGNSQDTQLISLLAENFWKETGSTGTASATMKSLCFSQFGRSVLRLNQ